MARSTDPARLETIFHWIEDNPGQCAGQVAAQLELPRSTVTRALPALEDAGYLLWEDERGRLWPYALSDD